MAEDRMSTQRVVDHHTCIEIARVQQAAATQRLAQYAVLQEVASEELQEWADTSAWNPLALSRNFQTLDKRVRPRTDTTPESEQTQESEEAVLLVESLEQTAEQFEEKNPELQARSLLLLRSRISPQDTLEEILRKLREGYPDPSLADEVLEFLLVTADETTRETLKKARAEFNRLHEMDIKAGRNVNAQAREFASKGLGSPTALRDLYRQVVGNPRDANTLFQELSTTYSYDKLKSVIDFILHSLGADMKSKGPSIAHGELQRLFTETRNMQAILGIYRFFKSRMAIIISSYERSGMVLPQRLTFELMSKTFMRLVQERYPSPDKVLLFAQQLGIGTNIAAQLIILLQFRDAIRNIAPKLFRDEKHRQDLLMCLIETLEDLDEELEKGDEEKKDGKK